MEFRERRSSIYATVSVLAVLAFFCALMAGFFVPAFDGTDENGYILSAKRLALTGDSAKHTVSPLEFVSENVVQADEGLFYAKYPLGYPWLCAAAYRLGGPAAVFWVNPILAALAVVGIFLLGRALIGDFAGALAAILLATNPLHAFYGLAALSHAGAICFAVWGMFFLWEWTQKGGWRNAALAGALTAYSSTVRYTEALLALPVLAMIAWRYRTVRTANGLPAWRREVAVMVVAAVLAVAPLLVHHWLAFGAPWRTGYALCGEATGFGWTWFKTNWWLMVTRLNTPGLLLVFPLGLAGLAYLAAHDWKRTAFLGLWLVPATLLYTGYYWAPQGEGVGYVRFFVSVFPPLIICGLVLLCEAIRPRALWSVTLGAFVAVAATTNLRDALQLVERRMGRHLFAQATWDVVQAHLPNDAVIVAGSSMLNFLEYAGDYELYANEAFDRSTINRRIRILKDNDPHPLQRRKAEALVQTLGDKTDAELAQLQRAVLTTNVAAGRTVAVIATKEAFRSMRGKWGEKFDYEPVAEWVETQHGRDSEPRQATWALYTLKTRSRTAPVNEVAALEEKADNLQFQMRTKRSEFDERYPGAAEQWREIQNLQRQLRDIQDRLKSLTARKPALATNALPPARDMPTMKRSP